MLDPWMQKFMGQCAGALKKEGIRAKGTRQFSLRIGEHGGKEIPLDKYWARYPKTQDTSEIDAFVAAAKHLLNK
jgi:hypothetical protein